MNPCKNPAPGQVESTKLKSIEEWTDQGEEKHDAAEEFFYCQERKKIKHGDSWSQSLATTNYQRLHPYQYQHQRSSGLDLLTDPLPCLDDANITDQSRGELMPSTSGYVNLRKKKDSKKTTKSHTLSNQVIVIDGDNNHQMTIQTLHPSPNRCRSSKVSLRSPLKYHHETTSKLSPPIVIIDSGSDEECAVDNHNFDLLNRTLNRKNQSIEYAQESEQSNMQNQPLSIEEESILTQDDWDKGEQSDTINDVVKTAKYQSKSPSLSSNTKETKSLDSNYFQDHFALFQEKTLEQALKIEYLRLHLMHEILQLENQYNCVILFEKADEKKCLHTSICHHQIKVQCNPSNRESIMNEIYKLLNNVIVEEDQFISTGCKVGRFLTSSHRQMRLKSLQDENDCIIIILDDKDQSSISTNLKGSKRMNQVKRNEVKIQKVIDSNGRASCNLQTTTTSDVDKVSNKLILANNNELSAQTVIPNTPINKLPLTSTLPKKATSDNINDRVAIKLVIGSIEKEGRADVIVNSMKLKSYYDGAIATALHKAGGLGYQLECEIQLQFLGIKDIGSTGGSYFGCKKVYHLPFLSSSKSITWLKDGLARCLEKAKIELMKSIAIPMIGIGGSRLKADEVIKGMIDVVSSFSRQLKEEICLKTVYFVILDNQINHQQLFIRLLHERSTGLNAPNQTVPLVTTTQSPSSSSLLSFNSIPATPPIAMQPVLMPDRKEIELVTKCSSSNLANSSNGSYVLYFTACCYINDKPLYVNLYHGNIVAATSDAIIDLTVLCDQHRKLETLDGVMDNCNSQHTLETLQCLPNFQLNCNLYQICPYGCLTGVGQLLSYINASGDRSVSFPLISIELNAEYIHQILFEIELFLFNHEDDKTRLNCVDFALSSRDRVEEIATWIGQEIKKLKLPWEITFSMANPQFGLKIIYASQNRYKIDRMRSIVNDCADTWRCHQITDEDYFVDIDLNRWHYITLQFWCKYNTILVYYHRNKMIKIHGFEPDILNAISAIHKLFASRLKEKAANEVQVAIAKTTSWYAIIGQSKFKFDSKMNYDLVKNYEIYLQDKTNKIFLVDSGIKSIDYENMIMTVSGKQYPIGRFMSTDDEITVPPYWDEMGEITNGYYHAVDVTNQHEISQITNLLGFTGLRVRNITRIQNWNLYRRYQIMKKDVENAIRKYKPGTPVEKLLFHGTAGSNIDGICKRGFDRDYSGKSFGSMLGTGTYFAVRAKTSLTYGNTLLIARVLTGIYVQAGISSSNKPNLTLIPGSQSERIHSVVDNYTNPTIFVVSNDNSAYPEYILRV
ncbi:Poly [ADP-ribose] polymerase 11 [Trichoplax sp. H2]|nr:Poly [ADP-ribose] polymerase 11 [Trichoplax sp. H2]|eukprot:RDD45984.1 Poly [ADP-ribose] polymerase 11 [Trichoplax sp. H2]